MSLNQYLAFVPAADESGNLAVMDIKRQFALGVIRYNERTGTACYHRISTGERIYYATGKTPKISAVLAHSKRQYR